ncbi:prephenate dehydrogenase/arogenate dehydrogenase family protein [Deltaproteobacteria bacterium PRO3]|nr:prephenate dehydrogenase/arogenate dehydrogenase family protein [Deltaproteobacteria bacterium PRO3]
MPDPQCPSEAIRLAEDVIRLTGGVPRFMDPAEHDALTAATEQLPALLGAALFYALQQSEGWPDLRRMVNPTLALAFQSLRTQTPNDLHVAFTHNRTNLTRHLDGVIGVLTELRAALAAGDSDKLAAFLTLVGKEWEKWDGKRHSGKWEEAREIEKLRHLKKLGFVAIDAQVISKEPEALQKAYDEYLAKRDSLDYELDGVVYKANEIADQTRLGASAHHPRWAIAYKFQGDSGTTVLREVEWSVSRTGVITPIGIIDPVRLSGATVSRVSLHNYGLMKKMGVSLGAKVLVMRRGGVIPNLEEVLQKTKKLVEAPERCPSCGSKTEIRDDFLYCTNEKGCRSTRLGELRHFVDVLEIEGFGDKTIEQLYDNGYVEDLPDFFRLTKEDLLNLERMGEILATKLIDNIQSRRRVPLAQFLRSLGIPELAKHSSEVLVKQFRSLERIRAATEEELSAIHTIGPVIAREVVRGLKQKAKTLDKLLKYVTLEERSAAKQGKFSGKSFLFTGKMAAMERGEAEKKVEALGGEIAAGVNKDLDYLVIGSEGYKNREKGNKWIKAEALKQKGADIEIVSEEDFLKMLE